MAQFDPSSAVATIALGARGDGDTQDSSSLKRNEVGDENKEAKLLHLDHAIAASGWDAVAEVAGSIATSSKDISTLSGVSSVGHGASDRSLITHSRGSLNSDEALLAARIVGATEEILMPWLLPRKILPPRKGSVMPPVILLLPHLNVTGFRCWTLSRDDAPSRPLPQQQQ